MKNGFYTIDVSCPIYSVLPEKIKKIFGERNRNICGQYVKFEPVGGNTIHFSYGLVLKNSKVQVIDMQQKNLSIIMNVVLYKKTWQIVTG